MRKLHLTDPGSEPWPPPLGPAPDANTPGPNTSRSLIWLFVAAVILWIIAGVAIVGVIRVGNS